MTRILALDTAGRLIRLEAIANGNCVATVRAESQHHVCNLVVQLRNLMAEIGWNWTSITAVGVNTGPGTFTGIRVSLAIAKAICYAHRIPLIGVNMFDCLSHGYLNAGDWLSSDPELDVVLEGQLQTALLARYRRDDKVVHRASLESVPQNELERRIDSTVPVTGLLDRLQRLLPTSARLVGQPPWDQTRPGIGGVLTQRIAEQRFDDPMTIEPFYARPSSAEEKWDGRTN